VTSLGADNDASLTAVTTALKAGLGTITGVGASAPALSAGVKSTLTFTASSAEYGSNAFSISAGTSGLLSGIGASNISSQAAADSAIGALDTAVATVNAGRSEMGATMNRLAYAADNMANISTNAAAARARVLDADYAKETTELARTQIISQAGTAMLAQANQSKQSVLALLK
jgi:flagellin